MKIRKTTMEDLGAVMKLYAKARQFMQEHGNPGQWRQNHPPQDLIVEDIVRGCSYLCEAENKAAAVFYFAVEAEPTYRQIYDGAWLNDKPYGVVHRIAAPVGVKGAGGFCLAWCFRESGGNIRIDTHQDNLPMRRLLEKNGYTCCGTIYLEDGDRRLAYQKTV